MRCSVLSVIHSTQPGGVARVAILETAHLREEGYKASVSSIVRSRDEWILFREKGVKPFYFYENELIGRIFHGIIPPRQVPSILDYDTLILHNHPAAIIAMRIRHQKARKILYLHDPLSYSLTGSIMSTILGVHRSFLIREERKLLEWADVILVNSRFSLRKLRKNHGNSLITSKVRVLYPTVNVPLDRSEVKKDRGNYLLIVGRIDHEAFLNLSKIIEHVNEKLIIAGYGNRMNPYFRKILRIYERLKRSGRDIKIILSPSDDQLLELFKGANLFVYPGHENFNMSALESMSTGTPVLVADTSGICEIMPEDLRKYLCLPKENFKLWINRVREILYSDKSVELGIRCWRIAREYNIHTHMRKLLSLI